jgi:hypothetical protein
MINSKIQPFVIGSGANVMIGAPARPIAPEPTAAIAEAVASVRGVTEAHLPQVYIPGVSEQPGQKLVLVLEQGTDPVRVMGDLGPLLHEIVPLGVHLDVWPVTSGHELLPAIREAGCRIFCRPSPQRPWWQIWRR